MIGLLASLPSPWLDLSEWVRVDVADHPDAIARSATGAVLQRAPTDGTPWRRESVPQFDLAFTELPGDLGDPVTLTGADLWHAKGLTGKGVKIAVFDLGWFGGETDPRTAGEVITHDCFVSPSCETPFDRARPHAAVEGGVHGWACAEAVRRIAPDAELHLVRANSFTMYENAVEWAIREGIDIISMSLSYYNDTFYDGTGRHDELIRALAAAGVLMVTSSGNDAQLHWQGPYVDADHDGRLDGDGDNGLWVYLERPVGINLTWNQYGPQCGTTDLDLAVYDPQGRVIGVTNDPQPPEDDDEGCEPVDVVTPWVQAADWHRLEVRHLHGGRVGVDLKLIARGGQLLTPMANGSSVDPAVHPLAAAVGAVRAANYWDGPPEGFSSRGPTRMGLRKPDIAGPDGISSTAYGPVGFFGTSASTPVVAGLIALVMSDDPSLNAAAAFEKLQAWAHKPSHRGSTHPDAFGAGIARLPDKWITTTSPCGQRPLVVVFVLLPFLGRRRLSNPDRARW